MDDVIGRRIAVVGAGQAGCQLALGLCRNGYAVTLVNDRSADDIRQSAVMSAQCMFETAVEAEQAMGLAFWDEDCPKISRVSMGIVDHPEDQSLAWDAPLDSPALSVDQRLKLPRWIDEFVRAGGDFRVCKVNTQDLENLATTHDLVVVATGNSALNSIFPPHQDWEPVPPRRHYALTYLATGPASPNTMCVMVMPGIGEISLLPALTLSGPCTIALFAAVPGGPMDKWDENASPDEHLNQTHAALSEFWPEQAAPLQFAPLTDSRGWHVGRIGAMARSPVGTLPSGASVLGVADAILLNEPTTPGQGANTAAKAAAFYLQRIVERGADPLDTVWMQRVGDDFWNAWSRWVAMWTESMMRPYPEHVRDLFAAARRLPSLASEIANGFDDAARFYPWWYDQQQANRLISRHERGAATDLDAHALRRALGHFTTGVTIVTARTADGHVVGVTANSFTSVSLDPPLVLWCLANNSASRRYFESASHFCVNVLAANQHHLSRRFALRGEDKFVGVPLTHGPGGLPMLDGATARYFCRRVGVAEGGDHVILIGEIEGFDAPGGEPLVFYSGHYRIATRHPDM